MEEMCAVELLGGPCIACNDLDPLGTSWESLLVPHMDVVRQQTPFEELTGKRGVNRLGMRGN